MVDWSGSDENVAEGRIISSESEDFVNDIPLGPLAVKVLVETAIKSDAFLWRPATGMFIVEHAVGEMIAWPASKCVMSNEGIFTEDIPLRVRFIIVYCIISVYVAVLINMFILSFYGRVRIPLL